MNARLELWPYRLRLAAPLATAHGPVEVRDGLLVRARDDQGGEGWGEVAPLPASGTETLEEAEAALEALAAAALPSPGTPDAVDAALDALPGLSSTPAARAGLEQALLDLAAQRAGVPLFRLLDPRARGEVAASALLSGADAEALAASARAALAEGYRTLKLKVAGRPLAEDLARVAAVRAAAGPAVSLRLDANGGWSEEAARLALCALAPLAPELCEQPLAPGEPAALRRLRAAVPVPLAADESLADPREIEALFAGGCAAQALVLKPPVLGGLVRALRLAARARADGAEAFATTFLEGAIGRAGALHLAAALGGPHAHGVATGRLLAEDHGPEAAEFAGGRALLSGRAGLGTEPLRTEECPVARQARLAPDAPALVEEGAVLDYRALDLRVRALCAGLRARGAGPGRAVVLLAEAVPDAAALLFAAARLGAEVGLLNARLTAGELAPLAGRFGPALRVAWRPLLPLLPGAIALDELAAAPEEGPAPRLDPRAPWALLFTSGSTGRPKLAELTVGAVLANARSTAALLGLDAGTRWLCCLPVFHVGGLSILVRCALVGGAAVLQRRFDAAQASRAVDEGATHLSLVATTLARTLDARAAAAPRTLRAVLVGGGPVPPALLARARAAGFPVLQTYGLTEAASQVTCERPGEADGATAGPAMPGVEVRVVDAQGAPLPPGAEGAIEVRSPALLRGYRGDPEATAAALADGWLRTGDLGVLDARGRLRVLSRRTDLIVTGGENVYPAEVEAALLEHPAVAEAAVAARPDPEWGEAVVALVVLRQPVDADALRAACRERLAAFKVPREVRLVPALPRTAAGKVDRAALRALLEATP